MKIPNEPIRSRVYCPGILRYQVRDLILLPYHAYLSQDFTQRQKHVNFIFLIETDKTRLTWTSFLSLLSIHSAVKRKKIVSKFVDK